MRPSQFTKKDIMCPICLNEEPATLWTAVNTETDPELKERLLRKTLQTHVCSNCGHDILLAFPLIYLEPKKKLLIACEPELETKNNWSPDLALAKQDQSGWIFRLTAEMNQLIEKIHIFDSGLDDRLVELIKLSLLRQQDQPVKAKQFFYYAIFDTQNNRYDSSLHFMVRAEDDQWLNLDLDRQVYLNTQEMISRLAVDLPQEYIIDQQSAQTMMSRLTEAAGNSD